MPRIRPLEVEEAGPRAREAIEAHLAQGYRLTNEKKTLLHNATAFEAIEAKSYELDRELQRLVGKRAADLFEYAVSAENDCLVCSAYFIRLLKSHGITDIGSYRFTPQESLLMEYGRAMARAPKAVPDGLFERLRAEFSEETIVVLTAMGAMMIANNYFNDILRVDPQEI